MKGDDIQVAATGIFVDQNVARDGDDAVIAKAVNLAETITGLDAVNYDVTLQGTTTAKITPATLKAVALRQYDATSLVDGAIVDVTGVNGETFTASGTITLAGKHVTDRAINPGSVANLSLTGDNGALLSNYNPLSTTDTNVTITQRVVTITAPVITKTYDGSVAHMPTQLELDAMTGQLVGADFVQEADIRFTGGADVIRDADRNVPQDRTVLLNALTVVDGNDGKNYDIRLDGNSQSVILPKTLIVRPVDDAKLVNTADVAGYAGLLFSGFVGTETVSVFGLNGENLPTIERDAGEVAEQFYTMRAVGGFANNYELDRQTGQFEILPRDSLLLRVNLGAGDATYGDTAFADTLTFGNTLSVQYWGENDLTPTTLSATYDSVNGQYTIAPGNTGGFTTSDSATFKISVLNGVRSGAQMLSVGAYNLGVDATNDLTLAGDAFKDLRLVGAYTVAPKVIGADDLGITGLSKTYDGNTRINNLALDASGSSQVLSGDLVWAVGTGQFDSRHVGTNIDVTLDVLLQGDDAGNYALNSTRLTTADDDITGTITQLESVQWVGADFGYWGDASNWAGGALPDRIPDQQANLMIKNALLRGVDWSAASITEVQRDEAIDDMISALARNATEGQIETYVTGDDVLKTLSADEQKIVVQAMLIKDNVGEVVIKEGSSVVYNVDQVGFVGSAIQNAGELQIDISADYDFANVVSGTGDLLYRGDKLLTISGANEDFTGRLDIGSSHVSLANSLALGSSSSPIEELGVEVQPRLLSDNGRLTIASGVVLPELVTSGRLTFMSDIRSDGDQIHYGDVVLNPQTSLATADTVTLSSISGHISLLGKVDAFVDGGQSLHVITEDAGKIITLGDSIGEGVDVDGFRRLKSLTVDAALNAQNQGKGTIYLWGDVLTATGQFYNADIVGISNNGEEGFLLDYFAQRASELDKYEFQSLINNSDKKPSDALDVNDLILLDEVSEEIIRRFARVLISENPQIIFNATPIDLNPGSHSLLAMGLSTTGNGSGTAQFNQGVGSNDNPFYGFAAVGVTVTNVPADGVGGNVTVDGDSYAIERFVLVGGSANANYEKINSDNTEVIGPREPVSGTPISDIGNVSTQPGYNGSVTRGEGAESTIDAPGTRVTPSPLNRRVDDSSNGVTTGPPGPPPGTRPSLPPGLIDFSNPGILAAMTADNPNSLVQSVVRGGALNRLRSGTMNLADVQAALTDRQNMIADLLAEVEVGDISAGRIDADIAASVDINCEIPQNENLLQCRPDTGGE